MSLKPEPKISIIVSNYNSGNLLVKYIESLIINSCDEQYEIIIVDNGSTDNSIELIEDYIRKNSIENINIIRLNRNAGYVNAVNTGLKYARGKYLVISNEDVLMETRCWDKIILRCLQHDKVGICAPLKLSYNGDTLDGCGSCLSSYFLGYDLCYKQSLATYRRIGVKIIPYPPGAFFAVKKELVKKYVLNPLLYMYYDDIEIGLRTYVLNKIVVYTDHITIRHKRGTTGVKPMAYYLSRRNHYLISYLYNNKKARINAIIYTFITGLILSLLRRDKKFLIYAIYAVRNAKKALRYSGTFKLNNYVYNIHCSLIDYIRQYV